MCKHETIRNWLIGYLTFMSVNWNLKTTDRLTGYLVKMHSTITMLLNSKNIKELTTCVIVWLPLIASASP